MGSIDLDPCSSAYFNETVKATQYYSLDDRGEDGLQLPWKANVFCNPPGKLVKEFWRKALFETSNLAKLVWVGFSLEQLTYLQDEDYSPFDFPCLILRRRVHFVRHDGYKASPTHGNYITGIGVDESLFVKEFGDLGIIVGTKWSDH